MSTRKTVIFIICAPILAAAVLVSTFNKVREAREIRTPEQKRFWYVEDRYKAIEKSMTLEEVCEILGKGPSDATRDQAFWLFKDKIIEADLVEIRDGYRVTEIWFPPSSSLPGNKKTLIQQNR